MGRVDGGVRRAGHPRRSRAPGLRNERGWRPPAHGVRRNTATFLTAQRRSEGVGFNDHSRAPYLANSPRVREANSSSLGNGPSSSLGNARARGSPGASDPSIQNRRELRRRGDDRVQRTNLPIPILERHLPVRPRLTSVFRLVVFHFSPLVFLLRHSVDVFARARELERRRSPTTRRRPRRERASISPWVPCSIYPPRGITRASGVTPTSPSWSMAPANWGPCAAFARNSPATIAPSIASRRERANSTQDARPSSSREATRTAKASARATASAAGFVSRRPRGGRSPPRRG